MKTAQIPNVSGFKIPDYKYITLQAWHGHNPFRELARLGLLQACERLKIEVEIGQIELNLLPNTGGTTMKGWQVTLPDFHIEYQSEAEWKSHAAKMFRQESEKFLAWSRKRVNEMLSSGRIVPAKRKRPGGTNAPLDLRYEWAAKRYFLKADYKDIASGKYNPGQIKQAVREILKEAELAREK